ncbi:MAG: biotin carboxyl carrier protein [Myxococcota bacterium]|jgi:biotin carboxyl carrier protein
MIPDKEGRLKIRANIAGDVEIRAKVGQMIAPRQILAVIEGEDQLESLSVFRLSVVEEILVKDGAEVPASTTVMIVREIPD